MDRASKANIIGFAFPNEEGRRMPKPLEIVHFDVYGPMRITYMDSACYFVTFVNNFLRNVLLYVLKSKGNCFEEFNKFKALIEI